MKSAVTSLILFAASLAHATNFMVAVGVGGLTFNPTSVTANAGDTIEFVVTGVPVHTLAFPSKWRLTRVGT